MPRTEVFTLGFGRKDQLLDHFGKHGARLGSPTLDDYCWRADEFLGGPMRKHVVECKRSGGDRVRYHRLTHEFGVVDMSGKIRTFYLPKPHNQSLTYFWAKCAEY